MFRISIHKNKYEKMLIKFLIAKYYEPVEFNVLRSRMNLNKKEYKRLTELAIKFNNEKIYMIDKDKNIYVSVLI